MTVHPGWRQLRSLCEIQFDFLVSDHHCRRRGRFISGGLEVFYWNATTGVRILVQYRDPFTVDVCRCPKVGFHLALTNTARINESSGTTCSTR